MTKFLKQLVTVIGSTQFRLDSTAAGKYQAIGLVCFMPVCYKNKPMFMVADRQNPAVHDTLNTPEVHCIFQHGNYRNRLTGCRIYTVFIFLSENQPVSEKKRCYFLLSTILQNLLCKFLVSEVFQASAVHQVASSVAGSEYFPSGSV